MSISPKLKVSFRSIEKNKKFFREVKKLRKKPFVNAGVTQKKGSRLKTVVLPDGTEAPGAKTVADIAAIHEFGAEKANIPERSFLRSTRYKNQGKYNARIRQLAEQIYDAESDMSVEKALGLIGQSFIADVKNAIRAGIQPPLKSETVRRKNRGKKGKSVPLIDTGQMINSMTYEVVADGRNPTQTVEEMAKGKGGK